MTTYTSQQAMQLAAQFTDNSTEAHAFRSFAALLRAREDAKPVWWLVVDAKGKKFTIYNAELAAAMRHIFQPGIKHFGQILLGLGEWMRSGIAWFGGLLAGIAMRRHGHATADCRRDLSGRCVAGEGASRQADKDDSIASRASAPSVSWRS